jgi:hypothetical protein
VGSRMEQFEQIRRDRDREGLPSYGHQNSPLALLDIALDVDTARLLAACRQRVRGFG